MILKRSTKSEIYFNTAGEIEARETAHRSHLTAEERAKKTPDLGWERAVFAEKGRASYDIGKTTDNKPVVIIKDDILSGVNQKDWIDTVKNTIKSKFSQGIPIEGRLIKVNRTTWREYTGSKDTQRLQRKNAVIYKDKLTASNNLDEIVLASTNYINEDLKHQRKDNIVEFARGEVLLQIGNNKYNAKVIVGLTKNNQMLLYDIVKFKKDIFKIKKEDAFTDQNVNKEVSRHYASSDKMISKDDSIVNTNSMQNSQDDAPKKIESRKDVDDSVQSQEFKNWFGDWQNDSENASKVVNVDGTPKIMYHGSPNSFTAFDKKKAKASGLYGKGFYFTDSESHAGQYGDKYAVYLNIKNPLEPGKNNLTKKQLMNFLEAVAENGEDYDIWNYGTENIAEIADSIYKNDAFSVIQDVNATAIGDFSEAIKLFNEVNGTDYDGIITPSETVVYEPTQIKSATDNIGTFDGSNPEIRFSMKDSVEDNGELIAVHNIYRVTPKTACIGSDTSRSMLFGFSFSAKAVIILYLSSPLPRPASRGHRTEWV